MRSGRSYILFLFLLSLCIYAKGNTAEFDSATAAYARADYKKAIGIYEKLVAANTVSPELYYNLGNSYYKSGQLGLAVLNYERARKLSPEDEDINTNLKFANQKVEDKIDAAPELFLKEWKNAIVDMMTERSWSLTTILLLTLALLLIGIYIAGVSRTLRQVSFYSGSFMLLLSIFTFLIARHKYHQESSSQGAIVISASATVTGSPTDKGTRLFLLHEGTKVSILEENTGWYEIRIANGNTGWLKMEHLQKI